MKRVIASAFL